MLTNRTIIQRHGNHAVLAQRFEVMWRDGSSVTLHPVQECGATSTFLRAMQGGDGGWFVFDLTRIAPSLADDLRALPARDWQGAVFYTLRTQFRTAADLARRAAEHFVVCWHPAPSQAAA